MAIEGGDVRFMDTVGHCSSGGDGLHPGMLRILCLVMFALPLVAVDDARLLSILADAEQAGFPSLSGATLHRGVLIPPGREWDWLRRNANRAGAEHVHARLPDGRWLIDLVVPVAAADLDPEVVAALQPVEKPTGRPPAWPGHHLGTTVLIAARWLQLRPDDVTRDAVRNIDTDIIRLVSDLDAQVANYPRRSVRVDAELRLRWALVGWFLGEGPSLSPRPIAGAVAVAPPSHRDAIAQEVARRQTPVPTWDGDLTELAAWRPERRRGRQPTPAPALSGDRLLAIADDPRPAGSDGVALGDVALMALGDRWGMDPAVLACRDTEAPWTDDERRAVAKDLGLWWHRDQEKPLLDRLAASIVQADPDVLVRTVYRRDTWRAHRGDRVMNDLALTSAILNGLATRWSTSVPTMETSNLQALLGWARDTGHPTFAMAVDRWQPQPWSQELLAEWADEHGRPQAIDALVAAWFADPTMDSPLRAGQRFAKYQRMAGEVPATLSPLAYWVCHADGDRWKRLISLLAADAATDRAASRLLAGLGEPWYGHRNDVGAALAWLALADRRPASPPLVARAEAKMQLMRKRFVDLAFQPMDPAAMPGGWRICDTVAWNIVVGPYACMEWQIAQDLPKQHPTLPNILAAADPAVRDTGIAILREATATYAHAALTATHLPIPDGLTPPVAGSVAAAVVVKPGMTPAEQDACRQAVEAARVLGFPDLTGAEVTTGELVAGNGTWFGPHLHLQDGSWLADGILPMPAGSVRQGGSPMKPDDGSAHVATVRLSAADAARVAANDRLGSCGEHAGFAGYAGIAWWLSGLDPDGRTIIASAAAAEVGDADRPGRMPIAVMGHTQSGEGPTVAMPDPTTAVRRTCSRWFRERARLAADDAEAERWASAARSILTEADRSEIGVTVDALVAVRRITVPRPTAPLDARLAAWPDQGRDQRRGTWEAQAPPVPASLTDLDGLIALLSDERPSRWIDQGIPRSIGDNALRAIAELTGVDWRWLVLDDPAVAAVAAPIKSGIGEQQRWHRWPWSHAQRQAVATALAAWWSAHRSQGPVTAVAGVIARMPMVQWDDLLQHIPDRFVDATTGAAVAQRIAAWRMPAGDTGPMMADPPWTVIRACLRWHGDPAVTAAIGGWPVAPWRDRLLRLRAQLGGGTAYDADLESFCAGRSGMPADGGGNWDWQECINPAFNLGLWAHEPTTARLTALRGCLAGSLDEGTALWMVARIGYGRLDVCGGWDGTDRFTAGKTAPYAIPAALALAALEDRRPIPAARLKRLAEACTYDREIATMRDLRVCDVIAYRVLQGHQRLGLSRMPDGAGSADSWIAADREARDLRIAVLRGALAPVVADHLIDAGITQRPADQGAGF